MNKLLLLISSIILMSCFNKGTTTGTNMTLGSTLKSDLLLGLYSGSEAVESSIEGDYSEQQLKSARRKIEKPASQIETDIKNRLKGDKDTEDKKLKDKATDIAKKLDKAKNNKKDHFKLGRIQRFVSLIQKLKDKLNTETGEVSVLLGDAEEALKLIMTPIATFEDWSGVIVEVEDPNNTDETIEVFAYKALLDQMYLAWPNLKTAMDAFDADESPVQEGAQALYDAAVLSIIAQDENVNKEKEEGFFAAVSLEEEIKADEDTNNSIHFFQKSVDLFKKLRAVYLTAKAS